MSKLQGPVLFCKYEGTKTFNWVDPASGAQKPIVSYSVLVPHGDGTVSRESITLPNQQRPAALTPGEVYGFPVTVRLNKKRLIVNWDARADLMPFPLTKLQADLGLED